MKLNFVHLDQGGAGQQAQLRELDTKMEEQRAGAEAVLREQEAQHKAQLEREHGKLLDRE